MPVAKGAALIAYLLFSDKPTVSRRFLAGLLWSESTESAALSALRQCLHHLRILLKSRDLDFLQIEKLAVTIDRSKISTDIGDIENGQSEILDTLPAIDPDRLLYGFEDVDPGFTEWLWEFRRVTKVSICTSLISGLERAEEPHSRLSIARTLNSLDPALEIAARPIIEDHIRVGNVVELLRVYSRLCETLEEEWGEEPSDDLQRLVGQARSDLGATLPASQSESQNADQQKYLCVLGAAMHTDPDADQDQVATLRTAFSDLARSVLTRLSDGIAEIDGCDACGVFGLPQADEKIAYSGIRAALCLHRRFLELAQKTMDAPATVRLVIGVDSGLVSVSNVSPDLMVTASGPTLAGLVIVTAMPKRDGVYVSDFTFRNLEDEFDVVPDTTDPDGIGLVHVLGRAGGVETTAESRTQRRVFVGRAPVLAPLRAAWEDSAAGDLQIASLQGPAGIGKTRVVDQFFSELVRNGVRVAKVGCNRYDRAAPLEPVKQLLHHLSDSPPPAVSSSTAIVEALAACLASTPSAIFIDDWQWADSATRLALKELTDKLYAAPVLVVIASRDLSLGDWMVRSSQQVHLAPMNAREVGQIAEKLLMRPIDARLRDAIYTKSGGNPLFLEEICHALAKSDADPANFHGLDTLAASLNALIVSRIDDLSANDAAVVFAAAPHSEIIDETLLEQILGFAVPEATLKRLCSLDVLCQNGTSDGGLRFKHGITRDVIYNMIKPKDRRRYHAAYFDALKDIPKQVRSTNTVELLALHARESGDVHAAADYAEQAGDAALAASSLDQAKRQYDAALTMLDRMPQSEDLRRRWLSVAKRWAIPCVYAASIEHIPRLKKAAQIAKDLDDQNSFAELHYWMGYINLVLGDYDQSIKGMTQAHKVADQVGYARMLAETTAIHGCALTGKMQYDLAEPKLISAIEAKDLNPVKQGRAPVTSVYSRAVLSVIRADQGRFEDAEHLIDTALARIEGFRHEIESSIRNLGAAVQIWRGNWSAARDLARVSCERSESVAAPFLIGNARCLYSYANWKMTKRPEDLAALETAVRWLDVQGMRLYLTFFYGWLADAFFDNNQIAEAVTAAQRTLQHAVSHGESAGASLACRVLARAELEEYGDGIAAARVHLAEARQWALVRNSDHELAQCALVEAQLLVKVGQNDLARAPLTDAQGIFERLGMTWHANQADALHAEINQGVVRFATEAKG